MYDLSEESVARLLIRDAQQLADRAKGTCHKVRFVCLFYLIGLGKLYVHVPDRNRCDSLCTEAFAQDQTK